MTLKLGVIISSRSNRVTLDRSLASGSIRTGYLNAFKATYGLQDP